MSAYWIAIYHEVTDDQKMAAYAELALPAIEAGGGRFLTRGLPEHTYEAGRVTRTVMIEFPDMESARATHDSPAYQEALIALDGAAVRDIRLVPGA